MNGTVRILMTAAFAALSVPHLVPDAAADDAAFRDPFWPVGYAPASEKPPPAPSVKPSPKPQPLKPVFAPPKPVVDWKAARGALKVSGYAEANGIRRCFVNGKLVSEGEMVALVHKDVRYAWRITRIGPDPLKNHFEEIDARPVADGPSNVRP